MTANPKTYVTANQGRIFSASQPGTLRTMTNQYKTCPACGAVSHVQAPTCLTCGRTFQTHFNQTQMFQGSPVAPPRPPMTQQYPGRGELIYPKSGHSATAALILSLLFFPGGMLYNRQYIKALAVGCGALLFMTITMLAGALIVFPVLCVDAWKIGKKLESGQAVGQWEFF